MQAQHQPWSIPGILTPERGIASDRDNQEIIKTVKAQEE